MTSLPFLGAALCRSSLAAHVEWLREAPRDLELQNFVDAEVLDGDWSGFPVVPASPTCDLA